MAWFTHRFDTEIIRFAVGSRRHTVVLLDPSLHQALPLREHPRLRIDAEVGGLPVRGAWQPSRGRWYLMLPRASLKAVGLGPGSLVAVAFRVAPQDDVVVPEELAKRLSSLSRLRASWAAHTPGTQRGLAHFIESARRPETRAVRLAQVEAALLGLAPLPWARGR